MTLSQQENVLAANEGSVTSGVTTRAKMVETAEAESKREQCVNI
jgi:hypothetical protein